MRDRPGLGEAVSRLVDRRLAGNLIFHLAGNHAAQAGAEMMMGVHVAALIHGDLRDAQAVFAVEFGEVTEIRKLGFDGAVEAFDIHAIGAGRGGGEAEQGEARGKFGDHVDFSRFPAY